MADNVTIDPGATPTQVIATDEVGAAHHQVVKLGLGAANAVDMHLDSGQQTMANSAPVVLASDQPFGYAKKPSGTLTRPANITAYAAEDEVGTTGTAPLAITVARVNAGTGWILGARAVYSNNPTVTPWFRLLIFADTVTLAGDNVALALSDADAAKCLGMIDLTVAQAAAAGTSGALILEGAPVSPIAFEAASGVATVHVALITKVAFTPVANSETVLICLDVDRD